MGELVDYVNAHQSRELEERRAWAGMLYTHAALCRHAFDGKMPDIYDAFNLWTPEEIQAIRAEQIKAMLMKIRPAGGG